MPRLTSPAPPPALDLRGVDKWFGAVHANQAIDLVVQRGHIHGIVGENGAGKSTLMSILHGFYQADAGEIRINGAPVAIPSSAAAIALGIDMVHQHFMLVERFTVLENVMLGAERGLLLARGAAHARTALAGLARDYNLVVDPDAIVGELSVGARQRVEILKALYRGAEILILDEPTGVLTPQEADDLFRVLAALRAQGKTILLVTHKLREIMAITDRVSVMRAGRMVAHRDTSATSVEELGEQMIGRRLPRPPPRAPMPQGPVLLDVAGLSVTDATGIQRVRDVSFQLRGGEIVGIAGVAGNGQSELLEALAGMTQPSAGTIALAGSQVFPGQRFNPAALRRQGLAHVPEDRLRRGLLRDRPVLQSVLLGYQSDPAYARGPLLDWPRITRRTASLMADFDVRPAVPTLRSGLFSGGNQQKLILAREMDRDPRVLLVGQPTRGVDIGGIDAIHRRLLERRQAGRAVLLVSVELDEILALADRILVMFEGRIVGQLDAADAREDKIGLLMAGVT